MYIDYWYNMDKIQSGKNDMVSLWIYVHMILNFNPQLYTVDVINIILFIVLNL